MLILDRNVHRWCVIECVIYTGVHMHCERGGVYRQCIYEFRNAFIDTFIQTRIV